MSVLKLIQDLVNIHHAQQAAHPAPRVVGSYLNNNPQMNAQAVSSGVAASHMNVLPGRGSRSAVPFQPQGIPLNQMPIYPQGQQNPGYIGLQNSGFGSRGNPQFRAFNSPQVQASYLNLQ